MARLTWLREILLRGDCRLSHLLLHWWRKILPRFLSRPSRATGKGRALSVASCGTPGTEIPVKHGSLKCTVSWVAQMLFPPSDQFLLVTGRFRVEDIYSRPWNQGGVLHLVPSTTTTCIMRLNYNKQLAMRESTFQPTFILTAFFIHAGTDSLLQVPLKSGCVETLPGRQIKSLGSAWLCWPPPVPLAIAFLLLCSSASFYFSATCP